MSTPHAPKPLAAPDVSSALNALRMRGLRMSAARRLVLEALYRADGPVTAEEIAAGLGGRLPGSDLGSVYRNLDTLERQGLIGHAHVGHGPGLYALHGKGGGAVACCERCGERRTIDRASLASLRAAVRDACGLEAAFGHFPLLGLCAACASEGGHAHS
jgi:Fur family ferric uptake transcriptional regulator